MVNGECIVLQLVTYFPVLISQSLTWRKVLTFVLAYTCANMGVTIAETFAKFGGILCPETAILWLAETTFADAILKKND